MTQSTAERFSDGELFLLPDWPVPTNVRAVQTTRLLATSFINAEIERLGFKPPAISWLKQVHGTAVIKAEITENFPVADACYTQQTGMACAVRTADCLPVLFTNTAGTAIAAAHAGWRGLLGGILENTVQALRQTSPNSEWMAWLGAAIGPTSYEVGSEVVEAFIAHDANAAQAVKAQSKGRFLLDLYALARQRLAKTGIHQVLGGGRDTYAEAEYFYSYRRGDVDKRMVTLIWLEN